MRNKPSVLGSDVYAVLLVGGKGKRLRPFSTDDVPKAFISVTKDKKTMFRKTLERIRAVVPPERVIVVANKAHARLVRKDFPNIRTTHLFLEPASRNTAPAIALAAFRLRDLGNDPIMVVLPVDHYIADAGEFLNVVRRGIDFITRHRDAFMTIGIQPTRPSTQFGYIKVRGIGRAAVRKVERFVEKPDSKRARRFVQETVYLWNAGMFIFRTTTFLAALARLSPRVYESFAGGDDIDTVYARVPDVSIDYAVMERSRNIFCVRGAFGWRDIGSIESLREILRKESVDSIIRGRESVKVL